MPIPINWNPVYIEKPAEPPTCGCGREFIDETALERHITAIRVNHWVASEGHAGRLRDITPSKTARAKAVIAKELAGRRGSLSGGTSREMGKAILNPDMPSGLSIGEFRHLWQTALDAELAKFK